MSTHNGSVGAGSDGGFIAGVRALTLSTVVVKIIGLIYKIPMLRLLGSQGMGYFNAAYEIYASFCVIATSGLPVAMSILISSETDERRRRRIFSISLGIFFLLGLVCMATVFALAQPFAVFLKSPDTYFCLMCISPAIFFICLSSAARGYFQGLSKMTPTAVSQAIEALGKLSLGLLFAYIGARMGLALQKVAGLAVLGLSLSEGFCAAYLFLTKGRQPKINEVSPRGESGEIIRSLLSTALPITLSSSVLGITKLIDMTMIFRRLGSLGLSGKQINSLYGGYTTLAIPLFGLAPALVSAVALPLVPTLSAARAKNDIAMQNNIAKRALKLTALISAPIGAGLTLFSRPILELIFSGREQEINACAPLLCVLGLSVLPSCVISLQNAMLQAYGHAGLPVISMLIGSALKIALCYFLVGDSRFGMIGVPIGTFVCDLCVGAVNMRHVSKHTPLDMGLGILAGPYFCAVGASVASFVITDMISHRLTSNFAFTLCAVGITAILYLALLLISRTLNKDDMEILLPRAVNT